MSDVDWQVSNLASRNPYANGLFFLFCRLRALELAATRYRLNIRTGDSVVFRILKKWDHSSLASIGFTGERYRKGRLARLFSLSIIGPLIRLCTGLRAWMQCVSYFQSRRSAARRVGFSASPGTSRESRRGYLYHGFLSDRVLESDPETYDDPYNPGLWQELGQKRNWVQTFTPYPVSDFLRFYSHLKKASERYIVKEVFLKLRDRLFVYLYPLRCVFHRFSRLRYRGFDLTEYVNRLWYQDLFLTEPMEGLMNFLFVRRAKQAGWEFHGLLDWYENQWMNRGLHMGFSESFPQATRIGLQPHLLSPNIINYYPLESEYRAGASPHVIGVPGLRFQSSRGRYAESIEVKILPALRFQYLYNLIDVSHSQSLRVLVALPQMDAPAGLLLNALGEFSVAGDIPVRFLIKPHPTGEEVSDSRFPPPRAGITFERVHGNAAHWIPQCQVLVTSGSGMAVEALAAGLRVVAYTGAEAPTMLPEGLEKADGVAVCYDPGELVVALQGIYREHERGDLHPGPSRSILENMLHRGSGKDLAVSVYHILDCAHS